MKLTIPFILAILLLSGCATTQQQVQKPLCPEGQLPAICVYCNTELCVSPPVEAKTRAKQLWQQYDDTGKKRNPNTPNPNTFICPTCKKENKTELAVQAYKWKKEREVAEKTMFCGTCDKCDRKFQFSQAQYDDWIQAEVMRAKYENAKATAKTAKEKENVKIYESGVRLFDTNLTYCPYCGVLQNLEMANKRCSYDLRQEAIQDLKMQRQTEEIKRTIRQQNIPTSQTPAPRKETRCWTRCDDWGRCYTTCD